MPLVVNFADKKEPMTNNDGFVDFLKALRMKILYMMNMVEVAYKNNEAPS